MIYSSVVSEREKLCGLDPCWKSVGLFSVDQSRKRHVAIAGDLLNVETIFGRHEEF